MNALQNLILMNSSMKITSSHLSRQVKWSQKCKDWRIKKACNRHFFMYIHTLYVYIHFNSNSTLLFTEQKYFFFYYISTAVKKIIFNDDVTRTVKNFTHYNERIAVNK